MVMLMTRSVLLSALAAAATTSSVIANRIVGGDKAEPGDYPYYVQMGTCGGALIAPDAILFAAHCEDWKDLQVIIGAYKTRSLDEGAQQRFCDEWIADPNYGTGGSEVNYDFALCKLNEPVYIDESEVRLEINEDDSVPSTGEDLVVVGLGDTEMGGSPATFLQQVTVPVVSNLECNQESSYDGVITEIMLCAGFPITGGKDSCQGDSGGPIVKRTQQNDGTFVHTHVGVVSWGYGCALPDLPGVYARTSKRSGWIKDTVCNQFKSVASYCDNISSEPPSCDKDLTIKVKTDKFAYETSWTLRDSKNKVVQSRTYLVNNFENEHKLCLKDDECYEWKIFDSYGDGIEEPYDESYGSYSFDLDGEIIKTGNGNFELFKTVKFCTGDNPKPDPPKPPNCKDSKKFRYKNNKKLNCKWVGRGKVGAVKKKCRKVWKQRKVFLWCPETCGRKGKIGRCLSP